MPAPGKSAGAALLLGAGMRGPCSGPALAVHAGGDGLHPVVKSLLHGLEGKPGHLTPVEATPMSSKDESQPL